MGCLPVFKVPLTPDPVDTVAPDHILQGLGADGGVDYVDCVGLGGGLLGNPS